MGRIFNLLNKSPNANRHTPQIMTKITLPQRTQVVAFLKGAGITTAVMLLYWIATLLLCTTCYAQPVGGTTGTVPLKAPSLGNTYVSPYALGMNTHTMGLNAFFDAVERINKVDSLKSTVGKVGIGLALQTNGTFFATVILRTKWEGYVTLLVGSRKNKLYVGAPGQITTNPCVLTGIGFVGRPHLYIGGLAGVKFYQDLEVAAGATQPYGQTLKGGKQKALLAYGLQLSAELRHVWVSLNLLRGEGIGVGGTYFF